MAKSRKPKPNRRKSPLPRRSPAAANGAPPKFDLKKTLKSLPVLACAPEMDGFDFDEEELREAGQEGLAPPEAIGRLADQAFHARLLVRLNNIKYRAWQAKDDALYFLGDAAGYYIEHARGPAWDNPLVVACYYKSLSAHRNKPFTSGDCLAAVQAYERKYKSLLAEKTRLRGMPSSPAH